MLADREVVDASEGLGRGRRGTGVEVPAPRRATPSLKSGGSASARARRPAVPNHSEWHRMISPFPATYSAESADARHGLVRIRLWHQYGVLGLTTSVALKDTAKSRSLVAGPSG
jgi:hypothetical protein